MSLFNSSRRSTGIFFMATAMTVASTVAPHRLVAQTDTAQIEGLVADASGAAVPNATVVVENLDTGAKRTVTTDGHGHFSVTALVRGQYRAQVTETGFQTEVQNFSLDVSQVQALNFHLRVGGQTQEVTVTDAAPLVNTSTSSTGAVIEGRQVTELPLDGRNFTELATLVPGVTRGAYGADAAGLNGNAETWRNSETGGAALSANGLRVQANNFELDGLDNNDALVNTIIFFPPVEATSQFRVTTSVASAEFGRAGGAIIQTSIKSGSNHYHGSAFVFDRDKIFDASPNYFNPTQPNPSFHRVQFGGTLGGYLWRDKLFAFGDYQGLRMKQPSGLSRQTVPTALERTGNFSELLLSTSNNVAGTPYNKATGCSAKSGAPKGTIYDPMNCSPFTGNIIPTSRMNQAALNYLNAFPLPNNGPEAGNNSLVLNWVVNPPQTQRMDDFDVRLDWTASHRDSFFARYSYGQDVLAKDSLFPNLPAGSGSGYNPQHPRGEAFGYTHVFTANVVNEFRYGHIYDFYGYIPPFNNIPLSQNLGILNANRTPDLGGGAAINGGTLAYTGDQGQYTVPQTSHQWVDEVSWTHGRHTAKFGGTVERRQVGFFKGQYNKGFFDFSGNHFTGFGMADMLVGFAGTYQIGVAVKDFTTVNWQNGIYAQDDWRVTPRLTLNLGVRYDLFTYPYEVNNNQSNFDLNTLTLQVAGQNGQSRSMINTNFNNVAPRFGFAYDTTGEGKTVLRGGYGIFYFLDRGGVGKQLAQNPDFAGAVQYTDVLANGGYRNNFSGQAPQADNNNQDATAPLPLPLFGQAVNRANPINSSLISWNPNLPTPMIQQWNVQVQQLLTHSTTVNIAYVGTASNHLLSWFNLNGQEIGQAPNTKLYPAFGSITRAESNGISRYNGLQIFVNSQMSHGLHYTAAYTWSHSLDNSNGAFNTGTNTPDNRLFITPNGPDYNSNYGSSDQDQRHVFVFSLLGELPFGHGRAFLSHANRAVDLAVGGWQFNTVTRISSGSPFDVTTSDYFYNCTTINCNHIPSATLNNRADIAGPINYPKSIYQWFNVSAFSHPAAITPNGQTSVFAAPGTLARNFMTGPAHEVVDASLFKNFPIAEGVKGQFRAEAYNVTNTPQFNNPSGNLDSCGVTSTATCTTVKNSIDGSFGQISGTHTHSERQLQLAFRLQF